MRVKITATTLLLIACGIWLITPSRTSGKPGPWLNRRADELEHVLDEVHRYQQAVDTLEARPNRFTEANEAYIDELAHWAELQREEFNMLAREYNAEMSRHQRDFVVRRWRRLPPGARPDLPVEYPLMILHGRWSQF